MPATLFDSTLQRLRAAYADAQERRAVAVYLLEEALGLRGGRLYTCEDSELSNTDRQLWQQIVERVERGEPIQHVLGYAYFMGRRFEVSPAVLIPRPETANLVTAALGLAERLRQESGRPRVKVVDAGSGSGCIAVSMALADGDADVVGVDVSAEALAVARRNAASLGAAVSFRHGDMLQWLDESVAMDESLLTPPDATGLWVANPPYIHPREAADMEERVLAHEPHRALFAPAGDPVVFYRAVAAGARRCGAGAVACEINPLFISETAAVFQENEYGAISVNADCYGKKRVLLAEK